MVTTLLITNCVIEDSQPLCAYDGNIVVFGSFYISNTTITAALWNATSQKWTPFDLPNYYE
jgi:hypothetical protein